MRARTAMGAVEKSTGKEYTLTCNSGILLNEAESDYLHPRYFDEMPRFEV